MQGKQLKSFMLNELEKHSSIEQVIGRVAYMYGQDARKQAVTILSNAAMVGLKAG